MNLQAKEKVGVGMQLSGLITLILLLMLLAPLALGLGLYLLGAPLDWGSWKTYLGLVLVCAAAGLAR